MADRNRRVHRGWPGPQDVRTIEHQVVHKELFRIRCRSRRLFWNRVVGEFIGVILWVPEPTLYHALPTASHTTRTVTWPRRATWTALGLPGSVRPRPNRRGVLVVAAWTVFSPLFYARETYNRVRLSLFNSSWQPITLSWLVLVVLLPGAWAANAWSMVLLYLVAVFVLFPFAGVLQTLGRHHWGCHMDKIGIKERTALVCRAGSFSTITPAEESSLWSHLWWWLRLLGYHLPARLLVLNGDVQQHDWHHRHPASKEWVSAARARANDIRAGCPG